MNIYIFIALYYILTTRFDIVRIIRDIRVCQGRDYQ